MLADKNGDLYVHKVESKELKKELRQTKEELATETKACKHIIAEVRQEERAETKKNTEKHI